MGQAFLRRLLFAAVTAGLVLACIAPGAEAHHSWGVHWPRSSNPADLRFINSVTGAWRTPVARAAKEWSRRSAAVVITLKEGARDAASRQRCRAPKGAVRVCSADYGDTSWAAITHVVADGNHIIRAKIKLNDRGAAAHRALACHEMGHALGLAHRNQSEMSSCLTPYVSAAQAHPDGHDIDQLASIYKHEDGSGALAADAYSTEGVHESHDDHIRVKHRGPLTIYHIVTTRIPASAR